MITNIIVLYLVFGVIAATKGWLEYHQFKREHYQHAEKDHWSLIALTFVAYVPLWPVAMYFDYKTKKKYNL